MKNKIDVYQIVTDRMIKALEQGKIPWTKPWGSSQSAPKNLISQKPYRGINVFLTASMGFTSPYWLTFNQAKELGASIKKDEKGTPIVYWSKVTKDQDTDDEKSFMFCKYFTVFNVDQIENLKLSKEVLYPGIKIREFSPIQACEKVVNDWSHKPKIVHNEQRAFYSPSMDYINMPKPETFDGNDFYYSVLFHELGHSTGHESRLKREGVTARNHFGSHAYSQEELVAEMTAAFLCAHTGLDQEKLFENSVAYLQSWLNVLKKDSKLVVKAAAAAQKAADMILNVKPEVK
jgi:antirestriction protein ArdC